MDTKKKRSGGFGSIFFMIIIIGIVWAVIAQMSQRTSNYKYKDFESDLKSGRITDVVISQNAEVPTGTPVSYTHLDVYKRQVYKEGIWRKR